MNALSTSELLDVWEKGCIQSPPQWALTLLAAAYPEIAFDELAKLIIGRRDALLISLRELIFGSDFVCLAKCPICGEQLELTFNAEDIRCACKNELLEPLSFMRSGYEVKFRLPNSIDLIAISNEKNFSAARYSLLDRCLLTAIREDEELSADQLPSEVLDTILEHMEKADPQGDVQLNLSCPSCSHQWQEIFDIVSFFSIEIDVWSHRILQEVYALASSYGWSEADILAMSSQRRRLYLEMLGE